MAKEVYIKKDGKKININDIDDIDVLKEEIISYKSKHVNTINVNVPIKAELDRVKFFIALVYELKMLNNGRPTSRKVSDKYKSALAIYILYGYNSESKDMVMASIGFKKRAQLDSMNDELRKMGLMYLDNMNTRVTHLCKEFQYLSNFLKKYKGSEELSIRFIT